MLKQNPYDTVCMVVLKSFEDKDIRNYPVCNFTKNVASM